MAPSRTARQPKGGLASAAKSSVPVLAWPGRAAPDVRGSRDPLQVQWEGDRTRLARDPHGAIVHADNADLLRWMIAQRISPRLVYIDPPYATQVDHGVAMPDGPALAYSDRWGPGLGAYLSFMHERLVLIHHAIDPGGFLFVQCDWRASAYLRVLLDEIFGSECFRNEIIWRRAPNLGRQAASRQLGRTADSILVYSRTRAQPFPGPVPSRRVSVPVTRTGRPAGAKWDARTARYFTTAPRGDYTDASIERLRSQGRIYTSRTGTISVMYFLEQETASDGGVRFFRTQPLDTIWDDSDVAPLRHASRRELAIGYVTQKPESLLRRIIAWASAPGDLVVDVFAGSGTTAAAAHALGRRWMLCDQSALAIDVMRQRLSAAGGWTLGIASVRVADAAHSHTPSRVRVTRARRPSAST